LPQIANNSRKVLSPRSKKYNPEKKYSFLLEKLIIYNTFLRKIHSHESVFLKGNPTKKLGSDECTFCGVPRSMF